MEAPSSGVLAAGTIGLSVGNAVTSAIASIPGQAWYSIGSGMIGLAVVWLKSRAEASSSIVENRFLRERVKELETELKLYRPAPVSPG